MLAGSVELTADERAELRALMNSSDVAASVATRGRSTVRRIRLMVDSLGARRPMPNRSLAVSGRSCAYSASATYERAPARTAATLTASIVTSRCRRPRALRGSGTRASKASRSASGSAPADPTWVVRTVIGEDAQAGTARLQVIRLA
jgi:hypothetical protein